MLPPRSLRLFLPHPARGTNFNPNKLFMRLINKKFDSAKFQFWVASERSNKFSEIKILKAPLKHGELGV